MTIYDVKPLLDIVGKLASIAAIVAAAIWFFITSKYRQRVQFDLGCDFLILKNEEWVVAEIQFIFENKGFVEHKLYNLNVSVHALESEEVFKDKAETKELEFKKVLLSKASLVPREYGFFFIRPGVRQVITHIVRIPSSVSVVRVTAGFDYNKSGQWPHTARRVFQVSQNEKLRA